MEATRSESSLLQIFVRLLDGKTATLRFTNPKTKCHVIKQQIFDITKIPIQSQRLISNGYQIDDDSVISGSGSTFHLLLRLRGGKGGFGSLLRGAATKAGQKKTNNFDACRDMSGRRLRHVNAEKKLEEWKAEEEDRRLEKIAEEFIKKTAKKGKKGVGDGAAEKYVEKYREESAKCVAAVEEAIRDACGGGQGKVNGKRKDKVALESLDAKKLKIWMGKRKLGYIDSGSEDDDSSDDEEESEKSVVLNNGNHSDSSKDVVSNGGKDGGSSAGASRESDSEEDQESGAKESSKSGQNGELSPDEGVGLSETPAHDGLVVQNASVVPLNSSDTSANEVVEAERKDIDGPSSNTSACRDISEERIDVTGSNASVSKTALNEEVLSSKKETAVNLDDFNSAAELEALGMERLKTELQAHGLKCGGTLQERAARLFLLKSTPLEKLPKKLFAKK